MKRILIIHHAKGLNGSLVALLGLLNKLTPYYQIRVLCIYDSEAIDYIRDLGVDVVYCKHWFYKYVYRICEHTDAKYVTLYYVLMYIWSFILYYVNALLFAPLLLKKYTVDIDLVYLNSVFLSDWALGAKRLKKKVILHVREPFSHGIWGVRYYLFKYIINRFTDTIIAISRDNRDRIGLCEKSFVVYDDVVCSSKRTSGTISLNKEYKYFLFLGGQARIKGFEQLVLALPYLASNIRIIFAGYIPINKVDTKIKKAFKVMLDPYYWRLEKLYLMLRTSPNVLLVGTVDNVLGYLDECHALISPFSKPHASLPILEAFYIGKPIIVSDVLGMKEFVDYHTGCFFNNGNPRELAIQINKLAELSCEEIDHKYNSACKQRLSDIYSSSLPVHEIINKTFEC